MKLYTKTGDDGTTGLFGGDRVPKDDPRVAAYGAVDELNASIGVVAAGARDTKLCDAMRAVQSDLFSLGAELATPDAGKLPSRVSDDCVDTLERWIDEAEGDLPTLKTFILPGGSTTASQLHLARTVCRRAERVAVTLARTITVRPQVVVYLNRLGDLLFALARRSNRDAGVRDVPWVGSASTGSAHQSGPDPC